MSVLRDKYGDVRIIWYVVLIIVGVVLLFGALMGVIVQVEKYTCKKLEQTTGIDTQYVFMGGDCLVKVNDRWIPKENWRGEYEQVKL